ncbi:cobalamin B12-binding domain-containing protein [Desulfobacca acetoxidans]
MLAQLIEEANRLPAVDPEAVRAYQEKSDLLLEQVNREVGAHPEAHRLIGYNPVEMMHTNHQNHARFMANVFKFRAYELLARMVVWVYRTYHAHGFDFDYFPVELSAWQQAVREHLDPGQTWAILAVYQWMLDRHEVMVILSQEKVLPVAALNPAWQETRVAFLQALLNGESSICLEIGEKIAKTAKGLQTFYLEVVQPCMYEIGALWERGEISVAQEHLTSAIIARVMAVLYPRLELMPQPKGRAVVTSVPNEFHETGARCVADLLALDGWQIHYLGANTPQGELLRYLQQVKPGLLVLSVAMPFNLDVAHELVAAVKEQPDFAGLNIMIGGLAFAIIPELWQITGAHGYAPDAKGAVELARTWWK